LREEDCAWLILGIKDTGDIVGTNYKTGQKNLDELKLKIADKMTNRLTFIEIYELYPENKRVLLFQIPAASHGIPTYFDGQYYGRDGASLVPLNMMEFEKIRNFIPDWSAETIADATILDLDPEAIHLARENYKTKFPSKSKDVNLWNDSDFLNKAKITKKGKITRTAILLLGKEESEFYLSPTEAKIRWILKDNKNQEKDYEIFTIPFLLAIDKVNRKIRNLKYRYLKENTLFPEEILQYDPFIIREALNNCIAHQDYIKGGRINVIEIEDDELKFTNYGYFIPGSVERVVTEDAPEEHYRNKFLATAMFNLNMVDTAGGGIKKMFTLQRERFFPMPEYNLSSERVEVSITGKVLDSEFALVLTNNPELNLEQIIMLDKVQKRKTLSDDEIKHLRKMGLIEGRKPNFLISSKVALRTEDTKLKARLIKQRGFDDKHYQDMILGFIEEFGSATRQDIDSLLLEKLPEIYQGEQKTNKINNLLGSLRKTNKIKNIGSYRYPEYILVKNKL
jgi:ATP-dependent DNA helicase RecG